MKSVFIYIAGLMLVQLQAWGGDLTLRVTESMDDGTSAAVSQTVVALYAEDRYTEGGGDYATPLQASIDQKNKQFNPQATFTSNWTNLKASNDWLMNLSKRLATTP